MLRTCPKTTCNGWFLLHSSTIRTTFVSCAMLRRRLWKKNSIVQMGVKPLSLMPATWAVKALQIKWRMAKSEQRSPPAEQMRLPEMERTIKSWFAEARDQPVPEDATFKSQAMSRRAAQDNLKEFITRQLLGLEELRKVPKGQHPIELIPNHPLSNDQHRIISAFLSETTPVIYADSPAAVALGAVAINERLRRNPAKLIIAMGPTNCAVANLADTISKIVPDTRLSLMVIPSVTAETRKEEQEDQVKASQWQMKKLLQQNIHLFTVKDREFVDQYLETKKSGSLTGFQERRAISLAINALQVNVVCCTTAIAEMYLGFRE
ncbi:hypothetical protein QR680_008107 [Steinernema hermaphroditum]|uniref:Uncharacterized protein n=1 Tax=Steinernema hermaphroditum TaxID=289476 RepID=A0AA39IFF1_9BILA|nr:hypothetical protein QR680_008107 [Steinernema hermaphroditum]